MKKKVKADIRKSTIMAGGFDALSITDRTGGQK